MNNDFQLLLGVKVDTSKIQKDLDAMAKKSITITPTYDTKGGTTGRKVVTDYTDAVGNATRVVEKFNKSNESLGSTITKMSAKTNTMSDSISKASKHTMSLGQKFVDVTKKVVAFGAVTSLIGTFTALISKAVVAVKELDDAQTDVRKVSDLAGESLDDYTQKLGELGKAVYRSKTEMLESAVLFKQAGYTDEESAQLAQLANLYMNIADSEVSAGDASAFLVSQMKAWNLSADEAITILDKVNITSNKYAVTSTDVSTALQKSASAMQALGNTSEQTLGLIVAGTQEMVGQSSKVAKGIQSIGINISALAQQSDTMSLAVGDTTKKIDLLSESGEALSTFDVLQQISTYWDEMNASQQTAVANALAG